MQFSGSLKSRVFAVVILIGAAAQAQNQPARVLPLNRFPLSRAVQTDANGFYSMPAAVGDDYFDGNDSPARVEQHLRIARRAGVKYLRCAFSWNGIEPERGIYKWEFWDHLVSAAQRNGIELIPYVAYTPQWAAAAEQTFWKQPPRDPELYAHFMYRIAARYRGRIHSWELWNEPDNKDYWLGTLDQYAVLVTQAARRVRESDPAAVLVLGGMANGPSAFLEQLLTRYGIDRYVDVVALHAYPESWGNERAEIPFQQWIGTVQRMIAADHSGADLWMNEMGYADYRFNSHQASLYGTEVFYRHEHTRAYQASMLLKFYVMSLASQVVSLAGWYRINDFPHSDKRLGSDLVNFHLGLLDSAGRVKPDFNALKLYTRLFGGPVRLSPVTVTGAADSQAVLNVFETADRRLIVTGWLRSSRPEEVATKTGVLADQRSETIAVDLPCTAPSLRDFYDEQGHRTRERATLARHTLRNIQLSGSRVFIAELGCADPVHPSTSISGRLVN